MPTTSHVKHNLPVVIIGGGPAGLMAAEFIAKSGYKVDVYDTMPSVGRKFLLAGVGGMNITHSEAADVFLSRYDNSNEVFLDMLRQFDANAVIRWIHELGIETFVGSSGRVFPKEMKAAPLLRAWLHRLRGLGVRIHSRHRWCGWSSHGELRFEGEELPSLFELGVVPVGNVWAVTVLGCLFCLNLTLRLMNYSQATAVLMYLGAPCFKINLLVSQ